ncbi:MAG: FtsH protease activity modulator HflK [Proteobacteria bacterium]|nr:FtsH protease activity modulator HflK [Desulfobulbaceae bacterium]MBU4152357.1 FtsH protease activity modulator HflK [Pseudomonadota bacterium]MDP2106185.1 FtsH protease activity modulator HflK [Desulfobulbaceae bacterium]
MSMPNQPQSPWGKKKGPSTPEEFIAAFLKKIKDSFEGGGDDGGQKQPGDAGPSMGLGGGFGAGAVKVLTVVGALVILNILASSFYTIEPGERGVILRLGKIRNISDPGLNFKMPLVDTLIKVDVETVRKEEFGFRTKSPGQKTIYEKDGFDPESLILTGDKNVIDVEWIVQYKVQDPINFLFKVKDTGQAVRDVSEKSIRRVVGNQDFDYSLQNREIIEMSMARDLQATLDSYESGIKIVTVKLQDVNPPDAVKPAFNEVNEADQDMKRLVNEAEENYNRVIPKAKGSAKQILEEAYGYATERVNLAKGEASRFLNILDEYKVAKDVTKRRMYLETMQKVLPGVESIYVVDSEQRSVLPLLDLGRSTVPALPKPVVNQ